MDEYYVYEWIRLDTNEPFYVGKGKKNRWRVLNRENNKHFNNIAKQIPVAVHILMDNLKEKEAYEYECYYIWYYRDIIGYNMCNISDGGENPPVGSGVKNNNYGNYWTKEQKESLRNKMLNRYDGDKNPNAKPVICIETGEIFDCVLDAMTRYGIKTYSSLTIALNGEISRTAGGKHWVFITPQNKEYFLNTDNRFLYLLKCLADHGNIKYYIDINTFETYNKKEIKQIFKISSRKFDKFLLNNKSIILVNDYLQLPRLEISE